MKTKKINQRFKYFSIILNVRKGENIDWSPMLNNEIAHHLTELNFITPMELAKFFKNFQGIAQNSSVDKSRIRKFKFNRFIGQLEKGLNNGRPHYCGYVVDVMYGKFNEAIFDPPIVIIFSNINFSHIRNYLSYDRWVLCRPTKDGLIVSDENAIHPEALTPLNFKLYKNSSYNALTLQELNSENNDNDDINKV